GLSEAFKNGIATCQDQITCNEFTDQAAMASNPCVLARIVDAGLTGHQKNTQVKYCQRCAPDGGGPFIDSCVHYFSSVDGGSSIGSAVIVESDDVADQTTTCASCDALTYGLCAYGKLCDGAGKDECHTGICR
ncbi:MAG: hypothetical protein ABI551_13250, partial [Polyangiaceae bacterium]